MMTPTDFVNAKHKLSDADFAWLEREIGAALPPAVRAHYSLFNGGEPEKYIFAANDSKYVVQEFFSIKYGKPGHNIEDNYQELVKGERLIPKELVPFASDPAGDFYCFHVATGQIVLFRSEHLPDMEKCITILAGSMTEFVDGLVADNE